MKYRVVRDDGGYAEAISCGDRHVLRLVIGATRNEEEAERVVEMLNAYEDALNHMDLIAARDAEWQAQVDTLLEDNARSEEQVKKQFATAVGLKARAEKAEARVEKLEAVLKECGRKLDEALDAEDWGEVESVWCDIDAALGRA